MAAPVYGPAEDVWNAIAWEDRSANHYFPQGVKYQFAQHNGTNLYWVSVDLNRPELSLQAVKSDNAQPIFSYMAQTGAVAAINGGFFAGNQSYSAVVSGGELQARNVTALTRNGQSYPVIRSAFVISPEGEASVEWVYHFSTDAAAQAYRFDEPLAYTGSASNPLAAPTTEDGTPIAIHTAIGGGPTLLNNGAPALTYNEEVFWGSGVELDDLRPRSAICVDATNQVSLVVATSAKLSDMPALMLKLNCVEAMNLDGGGSSAMAFNDQAIYDQQRDVPSALLVVESSL
ncbi:phosphodiester glycosidase family protein [Simiduia sp. 21SJ11W-1]|uniref:phosphodiester glycosidase family protein n=1 Tax=Simiduia sp. 21SJ11W-1 TaxID=2909669 RepID=UPI0020A20577|nr:phosphodiester glycosidase family protein [Simiduia sp. 21SJ11W-1]UTA48378.1 phosphodiester glycosidase family protein [Simiduia sp. 21SJ11W-1]